MLCIVSTVLKQHGARSQWNARILDDPQESG